MPAIEEDNEPPMCSHCSGTGEGMADGTRCSSCGGSGIERSWSDSDYIDEPDDYIGDDDWQGAQDSYERGL